MTASLIPALPRRTSPMAAHRLAIAGLLLSCPSMAETLRGSDVTPDACRSYASSLVWEDLGGSSFETLRQVASGLGLTASTDEEALMALCKEATAIEGLDCQAKPPVLSTSSVTIVVEGESDWAIVFRRTSGAFALHRGLDRLSEAADEFVVVPALSGSRYRVALQSATIDERFDCDGDPDPDCLPGSVVVGTVSQTWVLDTETGRVVLSRRDEAEQPCPSWGTLIVRGNTFGFPSCGEAQRPTETRPATDHAGEKDAPHWCSPEFLAGCKDGGIRVARARGASLSTEQRAAAVAAIQRGRALTKKKRNSDAIAEFQAAIDVDPSAAEAYSGRAYAQLLDDKLEESQANFETALALATGTTPADVAFRKRVQHNLDELQKRRRSREP